MNRESQRINHFPVRVLDTLDPHFHQAFAQLLRWDENAASAVETTVADILLQIKNHGDTALLDLTAQ
ncbi:MAG TPA: hypothetical protein HPQ00_14975, partial [Magnetococcales bacterium]|nr:hypothetical protein [Magnetococcales bacterium]